MLMKSLSVMMSYSMYGFLHTIMAQLFLVGFVQQVSYKINL